MTTDEIRIAMADLDGWTNVRFDYANGSDTFKSWLGDKRGYVNGPPGYPYDWDAVRRVVNSLSENNRAEFLFQLDKVTAGPEWFPARIVKSTPMQWCEAVLRACGKW